VTTTTTKSGPTTPEETIRDDKFAVPFTVIKPAGWTTNDFGHPDDVLELCLDPACTTEMGISNPVGSTPQEVADRIASTTADYVVGPATSGMAGNMPATLFDVELSASASARRTAGADGPPLLPTVAGGAIGVFVGNTGRIYVADVKGKAVTILIEAPKDHFADFVVQAQSVLAELQFV
jgi:hypothetical protein